MQPYQSFYASGPQGPAQGPAQGPVQGAPEVPSGALYNAEEWLQGMSSVESIADARRLMLLTLQNTLRHRVHKTFWELMQDAQQLAQSNEESTVRTFQDNLKAVEHWNARIISAEVSEIRAARPDLDELITGAFVSTFMVLASVRGQSDDEHRLKVPSAEAFVHECYMLAAQEIFRTPFLYTEASTPERLVAYRKRALQTIDSAVEQAVLQRISLRDVMRFPVPGQAAAAPRPAPGPRPGPGPRLAPGLASRPRPAPGQGQGPGPAPVPGPGAVPGPVPGPGAVPRAQQRLPLTSNNLQRFAATELSPHDSVSQQPPERPAEPSRRSRAPPSRHRQRAATYDRSESSDDSPSGSATLAPQLRAESYAASSQQTFEQLLSKR